MIRTVAIGAIAVALMGAQSQPQQPSAPSRDNMAPVVAPPPAVERPPHLPSVDTEFVIAATQGDNAELEAAQLAVRRTQTDGVLAFARLMITDHATIAAAGEPLVRRHRPATHDALAASDALALQYLQTIAPVDFDQNYAMLAVGDHLAAQATFTTEARDGRDPQLRAFALKWLPTIQAHLQLAVALTKHVAGDTPFKR